MKTLAQRFLLLAAGLLLFGSLAAHAEDAGCGLGSMIIQDQTKLMQIFAATTNGVTGTTFFGITSGTSNCKAQNFVMRDKAVQYFAEVNKDDLSREMAQGKGEKLATLAALYGCKGSSQAQFAKFTQNSYESILPASDTNASEMVKNLNQQIKSHPELAQSCSML